MFGVHDSRVESAQDSRFSELRMFRIQGFQSCECSRFKVFGVESIQDSRFSELRVFKIQGFQS